MQDATTHVPPVAELFLLQHAVTLDVACSSDPGRVRKSEVVQLYTYAAQALEKALQSEFPRMQRGVLLQLLASTYPISCFCHVQLANRNTSAF